MRIQGGQHGQQCHVFYTWPSGPLPSFSHFKVMALLLLWHCSKRAKRANLESRTTVAHLALLTLIELGR